MTHSEHEHGPDGGPAGPEPPGMAAVRMGVALAATLEAEQALNAGLDEMQPLIAEFGGPHLTEQAFTAMSELRRVLLIIGEVTRERLQQSAAAEPGAEPAADQSAAESGASSEAHDPPAGEG